MRTEFNTTTNQKISTTTSIHDTLYETLLIQAWGNIRYAGQIKYIAQVGTTMSEVVFVSVYRGAPSAPPPPKIGEKTYFPPLKS